MLLGVLGLLVIGGAVWFGTSDGDRNSAAVDGAGHSLDQQNAPSPIASGEARQSERTSAAAEAHDVTAQAADKPLTADQQLGLHTWTQVEATASRVAAGQATVDEVLELAVLLTNALPSATSPESKTLTGPAVVLLDDADHGRITATAVPLGFEKDVTEAYQFEIKSKLPIGYTGSPNDVTGTMFTLKVCYDDKGAQYVSAITQAEVDQSPSLRGLMEGAPPQRMGGGLVASRNECYWRGLTIAARSINGQIGWESSFTEKQALPSHNLGDERLMLVQNAMRSKMSQVK